MVDVPRRLTLSGADKVTVIADRAAPGSHRGNTNWSKPPTVKTPTPQSTNNSDIVVGNTHGQADAIAITATTGGDDGSDASGAAAVALGSGTSAGGDNSLAAGAGATASHNNGGAVGPQTFSGGQGTWALFTDSTGTGAAESAADVIRLGTSLHTTIIIGGLVISDGSSLWRLVVTGGVLSVVAYP